MRENTLDLKTVQDNIPWFISFKVKFKLKKLLSGIVIFQELLLRKLYFNPIKTTLLEKKNPSSYIN